MAKAPLKPEQISARVGAAQEYLQKRFPGLAFVLLVAQPGELGTQNMHSTFNVPAPTMRKMLQGFAAHHARNETRE